MKRIATLTLCLFPAFAAAETPAPETGVNGSALVTLYPHGFLDQTELATLRLVLTSPEALAIFVPEGDGFAAMAASPGDGFIRNGAPVASAVAMAGMADAAAAGAAALAACDKARKGTAPCVIVLEVAPAP